MNRFDREHLDGLGEGLSAALTVVERSANLKDARDRIHAILSRAREARDRDNIRILEELTGAAPELASALTGRRS